ncbi:hypothetical protein B0H14DRAFT_2400263, partial [Mycena olivaceomarginata]
FPPSEYATLQRSITTMVQQLDETRHLSSDPPDGPHLVVSQRVSTGGWPRIEIDPTFLAEALQLRGGHHLAQVFRCSPRTVRHRALAYGLAEPGQRVYTDTAQPDGTVARVYTSSTRQVSAITDAELGNNRSGRLVGRNREKNGE